MQHHTAIGQADADLTSATMALESLLSRSNLTPAQRRDFRAALKRVREAARSVGRHIAYGDEDLDGGGSVIDTDERTALLAEIERLKMILDRPDPHDFMVASEIEARYQMVLWGTGDGFPTAFNGTSDSAFVYLIAYLAGKVAATPDDDVEKKLHRVTTVAAAAANWHLIVSRRDRALDEKQ